MAATFDVQAVRAQFPALQQTVGANITPVFFDNPAGTQVPQGVIDAVRDYYVHMNANSGGAFLTSQRSDEMVWKTRVKVADFLNAPSAEEIVFGANMTSLSFALSRAIAQTLSPGDEIVLTRMDHDANVAPWLRVAEDRGLVVKWVDLRAEDCTLDMDSLEAALSEKTKLVATVHASNAVGTVNAVRQIAGMAKAVGALHVVDAVQSAPHVPIDVQEIGCDFLLCSAYKFFGPHIGVMWGRYDLLDKFPAYKVRPQKDKPPYKWENGTPSFETINAVGAAIDYINWAGQRFGAADVKLSGYEGRRLELKQAMTAIGAYERDLAAKLIAGLQNIPGVKIYGVTDAERSAERVPTVSFAKAGYTPR
ncbi:MAG: cysteine desulfurase-like protein, partial [Burkholderiales bacterium]|nr:cysteine desulfurase-like protein [Anaerolineae bacterium]